MGPSRSVRMQERHAGRLLVPCLLLAWCGTAVEGGEAKMLRIHVNPKAVACRSFLGFGAEWDSRGYDQAGVTDEDFALVARRVRWMRLPVARIMMQVKWCYRPGGKYAWNSADMKALYRHLDLCEAIGTTVFLTDWGCEPKWLNVPGMKNVADPKYAEAIATYMDHLVNRKGYTCIRYFILVNEPNFEVRDFARWKKGLQNVATAFRKRRLDKKVTFAGSDHSNDERWHTQAVDQVRDILGAYDVHRYARDADVRAGKLEGYFRTQWQYALAKDPKARNKPLIVGEAGLADGMSTSKNANILRPYYGLFMADYAAQAAGSGAWAVSAWMLDDNSHPGFTWGLWTNKAEGMKLKPWFFVWSLLSRCVPPGSVVYRVPPPSGDVRVLAARVPATGRSGAARWTFCLVNRGAAATRALLTAPLDAPVTLRRYHYGPRGGKADKDGFPVPVASETLDPKRGLTLDCPARAVVFLTSVE